MASCSWLVCVGSCALRFGFVAYRLESDAVVAGIGLAVVVFAVSDGSWYPVRERLATPRLYEILAARALRCWDLSHGPTFLSVCSITSTNHAGTNCARLDPVATAAKASAHASIAASTDANISSKA